MASTSILFPYAVTAVPILQLCSTLGPPAGYSALLTRTASLTPFFASDFFFNLFHFTSVPSLSLPFLLSFCFSNYLSFFFFLPSVSFRIGSFPSSPVLLRHFSSCPSLPRFSTDKLHVHFELHCYSSNMVFV